MTLQKIILLVGLGFAVLGLLISIVKARKPLQRNELFRIISLGLFSLVFLGMFLNTD